MCAKRSTVLKPLKPLVKGRIHTLVMKRFIPFDGDRGTCDSPRGVAYCSYKWCYDTTQTRKQLGASERPWVVGGRGGLVLSTF